MIKHGKRKEKVNQVELQADIPDFEREPRFKVNFISIKQINKNLIELTISRPKDFSFKPGQYVWIVLPDLTKNNGQVDRRAYSIYSGVNDSELKFLIRDVSSKFLTKIKTLNDEDPIEIIGPMGSAFSILNSGTILIAGGAGISPFVSMLRSEVVKNLKIFAYSSRAGSLENNKEITDLVNNKQNSEIFFKKSKPKLLDLRKIINSKNEEPILISGSQKFVNLVAKIICSRKVNLNRVFFEENYPDTKSYKRFNKMLSNLSADYKIRDIRKLSALGDLFFQISEQTSNHVILTDSNGKVMFANKAASVMTGYSFEEMKGQTPRLWGGMMPNSFYKEMWDNLKSGTAIKSTILNRRKSGELYISIATITPIMHRSRVLMFVATEEDITALRNVDKAKTEFVSFASHQLRAPLSIVGWYTEMLLNGDAGRLLKEQKEYLKEIRSAGQRMTELIGSLLDVSRLEIGTFVIEPVPTDMLKITKDAIKEQKNEINKKKINFSFSAPESLPTIYGDVKLLHMIVQNLLSNSIKYTPKKGDIKITLSVQEDKNIFLKVADTGYGIPKNQQNKIFTKLFRADNARKIISDGTGLGLYLIKSILEKIGGKIWFESEENKGSTFYVLIPIKHSKVKR